MGRRRSYTPLRVFMNSRLVGILSRERSGAVSFVYAAEWLDWEHALPVSLSLPLRADRYTGASVMAVFDNLLPDDEVIRKRVAERTGAAGTDSYSLLSEIGRDCVGALQFLPNDQLPSPAGKVSGSSISDKQIAQLLKELEVAPLGIRREHDFRISVAGAQEKTALTLHDGQWLQPSGTTPTTHIIKPQIGRLPNGMDLSHSVENEYLCLKILQAFGLQVAHAEMITFDDLRALVVERFDRRWAQDGRLIRLPQEDCCQALSVLPTQKYQSEGGPGIVQIMELLRGSDEATHDRWNFFKANVLFWILGATDGHAKNFSISLLPGGRYRMTPFYDVLTVQPTVDARELSNKDFRLAMRMGNSNHYKVKDIQIRHIVQTGMAARLSRERIAVLFEEIAAKAEDAVDTVLGDLPLDFPEVLLISVKSAITARVAQLVKA